MKPRRALGAALRQTAGGVAGALLALCLGASISWSADPRQDAVADYEVQLEQIAKEVSQIRRELDELVAELSRGELSRVFVFLESPAPERVKGGIRVEVGGKTVFSRPFTPAELDALGRGLPLELASLWLPAGTHEVSLSGLPGTSGEPHAFTLQPGSLTSWVAGVGPSGVEWRAE